MAGLKKKKKEVSTNPNVVVVVFLVFFVLLSIGLGVWGYYGYAGQDDLRKSAQSERDKAKGEKLGREFYTMLYLDSKTALGETLDATDLEVWKLDRDAFMQPGYGKFKDEKRADAAKKLMDELKTSLGLSDDGKYPSNFPKELKAAQDEVKDLKGKVAAAVAKNERMENVVKKYFDNQDAFFLSAKKSISEDNTNALKIVQEKSEAFMKMEENVTKLNKELETKAGDFEKQKDDHQKELKQLVRKINLLEAERKELGAGGGVAARPSGDTFPLLLDISPGRPLWDHPVGKITRVDLELRQVGINLGSAQGAKPDLTFNVFGAGSSGRAEKQLKGTIEIIKVVDANTSIARITSLYDAEGREILLNLQTRGRVLRETEYPLREGDLLFNLFLGTRVAIAGYVPITGERSEVPSEQNRQMEDFMQLLRRNGMQVDAYVDLLDGQLKGNITSKTRYLIRGEDLRVEKEKAPMPKMGDDDKEKEPGKEKEPAKDGAPNVERNELANKSSKALLNEAKERGLLLISAENFANVIGYRRIRSANVDGPSASFIPRLPDAGNDQGNFGGRPREEGKKDANPAP